MDALNRVRTGDGGFHHGISMLPQCGLRPAVVTLARQYNVGVKYTGRWERGRRTLIPEAYLDLIL